jgi:hypothetical protein
MIEIQLNRYDLRSIETRFLLFTINYCLQHTIDFIRTRSEPIVHIRKTLLFFFFLVKVM